MRDELWFKHDARSRFDPKMSRFLKSAGMKGYGIFWAVIEILHYQNDHQIHPDEIEGVADQLNISISEFESFIKDAVSAKLLQLDNNVLFQTKLKRSKAEQSSRALLQKMTMKERGRRGGLASARSRFPGKFTDKSNSWKQHQSEPIAKQSEAKQEENRIDIYASRDFSSNLENKNGNENQKPGPTVSEMVAALPPELKAAREKLLKIKTPTPTEEVKVETENSL